MTMSCCVAFRGFCCGSRFQGDRDSRKIQYFFSTVRGGSGGYGRSRQGSIGLHHTLITSSFAYLWYFRFAFRLQPPGKRSSRSELFANCFSVSCELSTAKISKGAWALMFSSAAGTHHTTRRRRRVGKSDGTLHRPHLVLGTGILHN